MLEKDELKNEIIKLDENCFLYQLDETLMWLFNINTGEYWDLNASSFFVLSLFDGKRTIAEISNLYFEKYRESGVGMNELMTDFKKLINQFIAVNVIIPEE